MASKGEPKFDSSYGARSGKSDLERWGIFAEMLYLHGQGMTAAKIEPKGRKGRQIYAGGLKWKTDLQDCYFDKEFKRIFIREAYSSPYEREAKARVKAKEKFRTPMGFRPPSGNKLHSTPGDFYGTFAGKVDAFDPVSRKPDKKKLPADRKPFTFSSTKKGGSGYVGITINPYPEYKGDKYDRPPDPPKKGGATPRKEPFLSGQPGRFFDPTPNKTKGDEPAVYEKLNEIKWNLHGTFAPSHAGETVNSLGGKKCGGFSKFPEYQSEKYIDPFKIDSMGQRGKKPTALKGDGRPFKPPQGVRSYPVSSVVNRNVDIGMNANNYKKMNPVTYTREFFYDS